MKEYFRKCMNSLNPYSWELSTRQIAEKYNLPLSGIIRFDQNTVPQKQLSIKVRINEYPDPAYDSLIGALAGYTRFPKKQIVVGAGADEIIDVITKVFIDSGDIAVISSPTYSMYRVCIQISGGAVIEVQREADFSVDVKKLAFIAKQNNAKIIFICNPNNPDGSLIPNTQIEELLKSFAGPVVVDEAYFEFCGQTAAVLLSKYKNLIIIRTLSKAFALAGARIGYAICSEELAAAMNNVRLPVSISIISEKLAVGALSNPSIVPKTVDVLTAERERIRFQLELLGFRVFPSYCNFLLFKAGSISDADRLFQKALEKGYIIRNLSRKKGCENCLRITIRTKKENDKLLAVFADYPDGLIFDIDGVLVDVSQSYCEAIKQTANAMTGRNFSDADVAEVKKLPNSNNDWDVTYALITGIKTREGMKTIGRKSPVYQKAKQKFQELYLGGLRDKEKMLITLETLRWLKTQNYNLGIVTSRPREEALYVLRGFIPEFFAESCIIAQEDCNEEKPSPKPLLLAKEKMGCRAALYVGDTVNDQLAAKAAKMKFASVVKGLQEADVVLKNVNDILKVL